MRWRKFSPIDRDWAIFELIDGDIIILDVTKSDGPAIEVCFHEGASGRMFDLGEIERLFAEVKILLRQEEA